MLRSTRSGEPTRNGPARTTVNGRPDRPTIDSSKSPRAPT